MRKLLSVLVFLLLKAFVFGQDVRIYHGEGGETVFLKENDRLRNTNRQPVKVVRGVNGLVTINIVNPNPFYYNYEIKTEDVDIKDEYDNQFSEVVELIKGMPEIADHFKNVAARLAQTKFGEYQDALQTLDREIKEVKAAIEKSDHPETISEAFDRIPNSLGYGFRAAIDEIQKKSVATGHFNSKSLEKDLNDKLKAAIDNGTFNLELNLGARGTNPTLERLYEEAFTRLNASMAKLVKDILDITKKERIIRFQVPVKENKQTTVKLIITKVKETDAVSRDLVNEEVAVILPLYVRKTFQVVPVVNLIFQGNRQKFAVENDVVTSTPDDNAKFNVGAMALMNFVSFGEFKEWGVGVGIGYSIQPEGKASSFFGIPSISYKDKVRIGFGFGYNLSPVGLKNGAKVNAPLPENISDIEDVIDYKRRAAAVFSVAISGLKL